MSTRSAVATQNDDGTFRYIYVHFDGYLTGVGKTLATHFNTPELARELIKLGDCSSLAGAKNLKQITFYGRDRGEPRLATEPKFTKTINTMKADADWASYIYVWNTDHWDAYGYRPNALSKHVHLVPLDINN